MAKQVSVTKTAYAMSSPFTHFTWPVLSPEIESAILHHLVLLLSPVGDYRRHNLAQSRGRSRKRRKTRKPPHSADEVEATHQTAQHALGPPDISQSLTVGLNSTVRCLEMLVQDARSRKHGPNTDALPPSTPLSAVFICTADLPDVMTSTLPLLVATAALAEPSDSAIRLIPISGMSAQRIAQALHQPKANVLAIKRGISQAHDLELLLQAQVQPVDIPWIRGAGSTDYLPVKVHVKEVISRPKGKDRKRKDITN